MAHHNPASPRLAHRASFSTRLPRTLRHLASATALLLGAVAAQAAGFTTTFDDGRTKGWTGPSGIGGATFVDDSLGADAPALHTQFENFGIGFANSLIFRKAVLDAALKGPLEIGLDTLSTSVRFYTTEVARDLVLEIRDYDDPPEGMPYVSVWVPIGVLQSADSGWQHHAVVIEDPASEALPAGWGGYGAEDPVTYEPVLPEGRNFADVLRNADEIVFTTLVPGYFYGFHWFDVAVDNLYVKRLKTQ